MSTQNQILFQMLTSRNINYCD